MCLYCGLCVPACVKHAVICICAGPTKAGDVGESLKLAQKLGKSAYHASAALFAPFNPCSFMPMQHGQPYGH